MSMQLCHVAYTYKGRYQAVHAVRDVSCIFSVGHLYAIMGKSGSGKTTLLSMMAGLMLPTSGEIRIDGESTADMDCNRLRRQRLSVIYQDFNLFPLLTVEENAAYPLVIRGMKKTAAHEQARRSLLRVGLAAEQFPRLPNTLSGGEQQRVAIARSLAAGSEIILADEPTGNLDSENSKNIVEILKKLAHEEGRCVIVVTHDPAVAEQADTILKMKDGRIEGT